VADVNIRNNARNYRRLVNYAEAEPVYPDFLTGDDLFSFYLEAKGGDVAKTEQLMADLGIGSYIKDKVGTYSSGMAKKLSLALALIGRPRLILLDEPLITLDQSAMTSLSKIIKDHYDGGVSFLITSHQPLSLPGLLPVPLVIEDMVLKPAEAI
jgi:ABC-2 type transport system ATP-binding protein